MNPTNDVLEQRIADMEGGVAALGLASGQAATAYAIQTITEAGDNIISMSTLYGGTYNLFAHTFPQMGIETRFVDPENLDSMAALIDERTKCVFCESIGNPGGNIVDLEKIAEIAHAHGVPLIVDNTVATPMLCNPFEWGADIIVHSLTKYISGHGTIIGGIIVDSNNFDWVANKDRFRRLNEPDVSYHGVVYTETGLPPYILRARVVPLRNMGAALAPMNTFLALQGLETLPLRMERICENTLAVAQHLEAQEKVEWVRYAGLESSPHKALADKYMKGKASGILTFGIKGGIEAGTSFIDALELITRLVNIGDAKSLACHPASTTHRQLGEDELAASGVTPDLVRLSIGIENIKDIIADIDQALAAAG
jgi:O-acetylhomoserine (thiol)-lyase